MTYTALIIDDDPAIVEEVADIVESLGHAWDSAGCMQSARQRLGSGSFDYILLDLSIPVQAGRIERVQNGRNLLTEIRNGQATHGTPVVVMTGYGNDGPEQAVELLRSGATDYIAKPFNRGKRSFDDIILGALPKPDKSAASATQVRELRRFERGELVFFPDRVELCGLEVCGGTGSGILRTILETLRKCLANGGYDAFSGAQLATAAGAKREQYATEVISRFRKNVREGLAKRNLNCGLRDVIENDGTHGYRLSSKVTVRDASEQDVPAADGHDPATPPGGSGDDPLNDLVNGEDDLVNDPVTERRDLVKATADQRREWVLSELREGAKLRRPDVEKHFGVSQKTATRDLQTLMEAGKIEVVGPPRTCYYRAVRMRR